MTPLEMDLNLWVVNNRAKTTAVTVEAGPADRLRPSPKQVSVDVPAQGWVKAILPIRPVGALPDVSTVVAKWDGRKTEARIAVESVSGPSNPPDGYRRLHAVFEGEYLSHNRRGVAESDPSAFGGTAWRGRAGKDKAGFIISGPYETPPQDTYAVAFRVKTAQVNAADAPIVELQVFNGDLKHGGAKALRASRTLRATDFAEPGEYEDSWLTYQHGGEGRIEYRVLWHGDTDVWIDRVVVLSK